MSVLRTLSDPRLLQHLDHLAYSVDPTRALRRWNAYGLDWTRTRQSTYGPDFSFTADITVLRRPTPKSWSLLVVRESWWAGGSTDPIKMRQWAHLLSGNKSDALAWAKKTMSTVNAA